MHPSRVPPPQSRVEAGRPDSFEQPSPEAQSVARRPKPRTQPPLFRPNPPTVVFEPQSFTEAYLPPLFIGLLVLIFLGSGAYLLWGGSDAEEQALTPEEIRVLAGAEHHRLSGREASSFSDQRTASTSAGIEEAVEGMLTVDTSPSGAAISIDGEHVGLTPIEIRLEPERWYLLALDQSGYDLKDTLVYVGAEAARLSLSLAPTTWVEATPTRAPVERTPRETSPRERPAARSAPTSGAITVNVSPTGAPVQLDGKTVGVAPLELRDVPAGSHTLTVFLPNYETATVNVEVQPGERESVDVTLAPQMGSLSVIVRPWGSIYVDGALRARDTDVKFDTSLPVGRHHIRAEHPELGVRERTVEVDARGTASVVFDFN